MLLGIFASKYGSASIKISYIRISSRQFQLYFIHSYKYFIRITKYNGNNNLGKAIRVLIPVFHSLYFPFRYNTHLRFIITKQKMMNLLDK